MLEIDFKAGVPVRVGSQFGVGRAGNGRGRPALSFVAGLLSLGMLASGEPSAKSICP